MISYNKIFKALLILSLSVGGLNFINLKENNYIYAQNKNIYQNELEADNQNKQNTFRVVYHDSIDDNVKEEDILKYARDKEFWEKLIWG